MRLAPSLTISIVLLAGCSGGGDGDSAATTSSGSAAIAAVDLTNACAFLGAADFAAAGFTADGEGIDVSDSFNVSTTSSVACQWTTTDDNIGSSWELIIGRGEAQAAYDFELSFAQQDTITTLDLVDEAFLVDKVSSFDSADHDFEVAVRRGDTFFTLSTTDDRGVEAIVALATLVANQLAA